jgi:hypothetical protein
MMKELAYVARCSRGVDAVVAHDKTPNTFSLFVWLVPDGWCWFVLREKYC